MTGLDPRGVIQIVRNDFTGQGHFLYWALANLDYYALGLVCVAGGPYYWT
jgi:hypothetical protein